MLVAGLKGAALWSVHISRYIDRGPVATVAFFKIVSGDTTRPVCIKSRDVNSILHSKEIL